MALPIFFFKPNYAESEEDKYQIYNIFKNMLTIIWLLSAIFFFCPYQQTPLHIATREGYKLTVESLVDKGANTNIQDKAGVSMKTLLRVITVIILIER